MSWPELLPAFVASRCCKKSGESKIGQVRELTS